MHPVEAAIDALERGIRRRSRRIVCPAYVGALLPIRMAAQRVAELAAAPGLGRTLEIARSENAPLTTPQPEREEPSQASRR